MRGLSLWQPWATLVACGAKQIETRSWPTPYRGLVAIHAALAFPPEAARACGNEDIAVALENAGIRCVSQLPRGVILATARLANCWQFGEATHWHVGYPECEFGDFTDGRWGFVLEEVRALPEPIPCRGALGLWRVPAGVLAQLGALPEPEEEPSLALELEL